MPSHHRRAFTLVEALVSMSITAVAGAAVLLGIAGSMQATDAAVEGTIAAAMAQQLMDEIAGQAYREAGSDPYQPYLGPEGSERQGLDRSQFDDIDDYHLLAAQPPVDRWGVPLAQEDGQGGRRHPTFQMAGPFDRWRQAVEVNYVDAASLDTPLPPGSTSDYRAVHVRVFVADPQGGSREVAHLARVFSYVPNP